MGPLQLAQLVTDVLPRSELAFPGSIRELSRRVGWNPSVVDKQRHLLQLYVKDIVGAWLVT